QFSMKADWSKLNNLKDVSDVYCSYLDRTRETAEIVFGEMMQRRKIKPEKIEEFNEIDFGNYEGLPFSSMTKDEKERWEVSPELMTMPRGDNVGTRIIKMREKIYSLVAEAEGDIVIISSGTIIRLLMANLRGLPICEGHKIEIPNCATFFLEYRDGILREV
ncbi:MAG: histidine phosphatase family protein, partial [Dehalococcoidales bacterium]|nr:histidine phosphatase family protein [Dehalococcoidales bacterium]